MRGWMATPGLGEWFSSHPSSKDRVPEPARSVKYQVLKNIVNLPESQFQVAAPCHAADS